MNAAQTGADLSSLLQLPGVMAAGRFSPDGTLLDFQSRSGMQQDMAEMTAQFCATVTMMFNALAGAHTRISGMQWLPQQGWTYSGGEWTVATGNGMGVFLRTEQADFNLLFQALAGNQKG